MIVIPLDWPDEKRFRGYLNLIVPTVVDGSFRGEVQEVSRGISQTLARGKTLNGLDGQLASYDFELPQSFVAQRPVSPRDRSKLLVYHCSTGEVEHTYFYQLHHYLPRGSHVILNNSKVFACRLWGSKKQGGKAEIFLLAPKLNERGEFSALIKCSGKKRVGDSYVVHGVSLELVGQGRDGIFWLRGDLDKLRSLAMVPIPPYIRSGVGDERDERDYQTLYAKNEGSVAAPTAGLHFTPEVFAQLTSRQIATHSLTLHVGRGTFAPINTETLKEHQMHEEEFFIPPETEVVIGQNWGKLFCVGTTCLRVLQSLADDRGDYRGDDGGGIRSTDLFLCPGKPITAIKGLITNFHLPKSSLFILVCALIGRQKALQLYELAKDKSYRFFSYGDAMLVLR